MLRFSLRFEYGLSANIVNLTSSLLSVDLDQKPAGEARRAVWRLGDVTVRPRNQLSLRSA